MKPDFSARWAIIALLFIGSVIAVPLYHSHSSDWVYLDRIGARETGGEIQILLHTTAPASHRVVSDNNLKIVIELPGARLVKPQVLEIHRGQVALVRAAVHSTKPYATWVVVELSRPSKYRVETSGDNSIVVRIPLDPLTAPEPLPLTSAGGTSAAIEALVAGATAGIDDGGSATTWAIPGLTDAPVVPPKKTKKFPDGPPSLPLPPAPSHAAVSEIPSGFGMDLHSDAILRMMEYGSGVGAMGGGNVNGLTLKTSVPMLRAGGMTGQVYAVYVPRGQGFAWTMDSIGLFYEVLSTYPDLAFAGSVGEVKRNLEAGRISAFLSIEAGEAIEADLDKIDYLQRLGVRCFGLTWNRHNLIADAQLPKAKAWGGLSPFGEQVIQRLNRVGIIVDIAHASHETIMDVLATSTDPIMASHTNAYALNPHWRNLTDEEIRGICSRGGIVGVSFYRTFLSNQRPVYASSIADHIVHVARVGGIGCPALGSDFDGGINGPEDLRNISQIGSLTRELQARGFSQEQIDLVYGKNFLRLIALMDAKHPPLTSRRPSPNPDAERQASINPQHPNRD